MPGISPLLEVGYYGVRLLPGDSPLRMRAHRNQGFIISILLMLVCVQTLAMHFHFPAGETDQHTHVHAHASGGMEADHLGTGHDDEATSDLPGVAAKLTLSVGIFVFILLALVAVAQTRLCIRNGMRRKPPRCYLQFYRPPLRAPPL